eukprot:COSAG04_NODE_6772_length_1260_cov_1.645995_3_plen_154_part_01
MALLSLAVGVRWAAAGLCQQRGARLLGMISFGPKKTQPTGHAEQIKAWAAAALAGADGGSPFEADVTLMVAELECHEPGCPPIETVVSVLDKANPQKLKIGKAMADVAQADVAAAVTALLQAGAEPAAEPEGCEGCEGDQEDSGDETGTSPAHA